MGQTRWKMLEGGDQAQAPGEEDLRLVQELAGRPVEQDEVYLRSVVLCTGEYDRDHERFSDEVLAQFARTIVGKSLLVGHRHDSTPEGLFYRAEVVPRTGAASALQAGFYMIKTEGNEHIRTLMDGGVIRYTSIGFRCDKLLCDLCGRNKLREACPHALGLAYNGVTATATWAGEAEALEGSLVYLGSQYGAMVVKMVSAEAAVSQDWLSLEVDRLVDRIGALTEDLRRSEAELAAARVEAAEGQRAQGELKAELRALCALSGDGLVWRVLEPMLDRMSAGELREACERVRRDAEPVSLAYPRGRQAASKEPDLRAYVC